MIEFTGFTILIVALIVYFAPSLLAGHRRLASGGVLLAVNLFLGWTVIGWFSCLLWAALGQTDDQAQFYHQPQSPQLPQPPNVSDTKKCPDCAETILRAAKVCKHCGCKEL